MGVGFKFIAGLYFKKRLICPHLLAPPNRFFAHKMNLHRFIVPALFTIGVTAQAVEVPFNYSFTATNLGGPVSSISGSFSGSYIPSPVIPEPGNPIDPDPSTLTSINLTIGGFTYNTGNTNLRIFSTTIGYTFLHTTFWLYGSSNGVAGSGFHDNFALHFYIPEDGQPKASMFYYATPASPLFFDEDANIGTYRITANVPDPGAALNLFCVGLLVVAGIYRRLFVAPECGAG